MAGWLWNNQKSISSEGLDGNEMMMDVVLSHKPGLDLLQNCDLPPPLKVLSGPDNVLSSMNRIYGMMVQEDELNESRSVAENEKLELLKALRLSQTRAREAEKKAAVLAKERDCLRNALLEESLKLFSYGQWLKLLELQLSKLQKQQQEEEEEEEQACACTCNGCWIGSSKMGPCTCSGCCIGSSKMEDDCEACSGSMTWFVALALCLGFAFGCRYLF